MIEVLHLRQPPDITSKVIELSLTERIGTFVGNLASKGMGGKPWGATTLPLPFVTVILYNGSLGTIDPLIRVHEFQHVRQREKAGSWWRSAYRYIREHIRSGYDLNIFELEAYSVQAEAAANGLPDWAKP